MGLSDKQALLQTRVGDLSTYLRTAKAVGLSNRSIAKRLHAQTGVSVSYESVRLWLAELDKDAAA